MTASGSPRAELRKMIIRRLSTDEWMERHFGVICHAGDIADAVMELFPIVSSERLMVVDDEPYVLPGEVRATHRRYVLRTAPELIEGDTHAD